MAAKRTTKASSRKAPAGKAKAAPAKATGAPKKAKTAKKPARSTKTPSVSTKPATNSAKKPASKPKSSPVSRPPRAPGEKRYWLVKTEPDVFSYADLERSPDRTTYWDGVRNYQARNTMRDDMKLGDLVLVYHSNADPPHVAGIAEVVREGYPDPTQFDPGNTYFDPKSKPAAPTWMVVDLRAVKPLRAVGLPELRLTKGLEKMVLLQKGSRLSVQPVSPAEWEIVTRLGGA